jgi:hypothetical protein
MEPALETKRPNSPVQDAPDARCTQCGEKLATQALPARRTEVQICIDCSVYDLPHTD